MPITHKDRQFNTKNIHFKTRVALSLQAEIQNVALMLLSRYIGVFVKRPSKQAKITTQFQRVKNLIIGDEVLDVQKVVKARCLLYSTLMEKEGVKEETIKRRMQPYKRREVVNLLLDVLFEFGVVLLNARDESDGILGNVCFYNFHNKTIVYNIEQIKEVGKIVSNRIASIVACENVSALSQIALF
ncbi:hypothetical protein EIN_163940 [Entamoeba invadens IP1]|uniref:Uncharacterized protein n=1 Tax=Entamoeba invadens IP1 TaxID=370355 RepID=A0A0A1UA55_ENTIV|nr:hypothetical protein EIN_163940 [Entamoeba invadens IP1]ELP89024.1 hypothetical protein EIN_163940 [Entamoeba invadens IP1]|eukprot:XP_004255795.1 hypothetical protein EIN_163940 [Entamoeba invadens IP1]